MKRIKKLSRWSIAGIGLALLLGVGGLRIASAAQTPMSITLPGLASGDGTCDGDCLSAYGTGILFQGAWYNYSSCDQYSRECTYVWEFA